MTLSSPPEDGRLASCSHKLAVIAILALVTTRANSGEDPMAPKADQTLKGIALTETVEKRLVQLEVDVEGNPEVIRGITADDFVLFVGEREIHGLTVDRLCDGASNTSESATRFEPSAQSQSPNIAPPTPRPRATFIFFFDQPHLTQAGRKLSIDLARQMITGVVVNGARAAIVSNAKRVETIVPSTEAQDRLLSGLERLRTDSRQWDSYSDAETSRAEEIRFAYEMDPTRRCPPWLAKTYAREEYLIARQSTQRIANALGVLAEVPAPKALIYFGDTLRQRAGEHYLHVVCPGSGAAQIAEAIPSAAAEFDTVINEALARGVRFFTIQGEGILGYSPGWDTERHRDAQDALMGLAAETGGEAFLGGASHDYIVGRIARRSSCLLVLSFPPADLPTDKPLGVALTLNAPEVRLRVQGRIVVPSARSIEHAKILAAFLDPASSDDGSLRVFLIPRGGDGKQWYTAVQLRLRPSGIPDSSVELGASIVRRDKVPEHFAASIATRSGTRALVLEKRLNVASGQFAVVAVAHDRNRGDIASSRLEADFPDLANSRAAIAPIAVLQQSSVAMSRDGAVTTSGLLARDLDELLDPSAPVTLETAVCRGARTKEAVLVERWLADGLVNEFAPITITATDEPCVESVDVLAAGRLKSGVVDYRVLARVGDDVVAQERRTLQVGTKP